MPLYATLSLVLSLREISRLVLRPVFAEFVARTEWCNLFLIFILFMQLSRNAFVIVYRILLCFSSLDNSHTERALKETFFHQS